MVYLVIKIHISYITTVLDISKHVELYNNALSVLSSLATNPSTQHLLTLPVFSPGGEGVATGGVTSLASLLAKLREIALIYQKTARYVYMRIILKQLVR